MFEEINVCLNVKETSTVGPMQPALTLNGAEVDAIEAAIELAFDTGLQDRTAMLIESVAALSTIDTLISIAKKRQNEENKKTEEDEK